MTVKVSYYTLDMTVRDLKWPLTSKPRLFSQASEWVKEGRLRWIKLGWWKGHLSIQAS